MAIIPADEKVFMVDKRTNTTYGGSQALQDMQQWYTMQDVADSVQPYKVFTALLTQSGEDDPNTLESGDLLTIGVTYLIGNGDNDPGDFLNVGAPNNDEGTYFVATGETPNKWGKTSLAYNTGAPVVTVLENTIGNVWFTYADIGLYKCVSNGLFNSSTIVNNIPNQYVVGGSTMYNFGGYSLGQNIQVFISSHENFDPTNGLYGSYAQNTIEIRVYN